MFVVHEVIVPLVGKEDFSLFCTILLHFAMISPQITRKTILQKPNSQRHDAATLRVSENRPEPKRETGLDEGTRNGLFRLY